MAELYTYAVSRIHAKESDLLTANELEQLILCPDFNSAIKYLTEQCGYGTERYYSNFDELRQDETEKMWDLIHELVPDTEVFKTIFRPIDYHNLKAAVKMVFTSEISDGYFQSGGTIAADIIYNSVKHKSYSDLPNFLKAAAETAVEKFAKNGDGLECDIYIDKMCLETMINDGIESNAEVIREYTECFAALTDIKIAVRGARMQKSGHFFKNALAHCRSINAEALGGAAVKGEEEIYKYLMHTDYRDAVDKLKISMSEFEKWSDNFIIKIIKKQKSNSFTVEPIFAYILAKQNEIKAVQIILAGKKNELDNDFIRERIRDLYV